MSERISGFAEGETGIFNLYICCFSVFIPVIYAFNLAYVFSFFMAAVGAFLFARRLKNVIFASSLAGFILLFRDIYNPIYQSGKYPVHGFFSLDYFVCRYYTAEFFPLSFLIYSLLFPSKS